MCLWQLSYKSLSLWTFSITRNLTTSEECSFHLAKHWQKSFSSFEPKMPLPVTFSWLKSSKHQASPQSAGVLPHSTESYIPQLSWLCGYFCPHHPTLSLLFPLWFFKIGVFGIALKPFLELAMQTRLASNSQRSACLCLPSTGIKGVRHYCPASLFLLPLNMEEIEPGQELF